MTFLELHQTLLGFVLFKLYTDINLVYPPPLDAAKEAAGAGFDSFVLKAKKDGDDEDEAETKAAAGDKQKVTKKDVKKGIRSVAAAAASAGGMDVDVTPVASGSKTAAVDEELDEFVEQPSKSDPSSTAALPTLSQLATSSAATSALTSLFAPYKVYLSRSVPRQTAEFILRSFGCAQVGWDTRSMGEGADFTDPTDPGVTHVIVDRPAGSDGAFVFEEGGALPAGQVEHRTFVQPQWIVDSLNDGRLKPAGDYAPGGVLPPHLSPFGKEAGSYASDSRNAGVAADDVVADAEMAAAASDSDDDDDEEDESAAAEEEEAPPALLASAVDPSNELLRRAAELEAEQTGTSIEAFEARLAAETKKARKTGASKEKAKSSGKADEDEDLRRIMMSNKQKCVGRRGVLVATEDAADLALPSPPFAGSCSRRWSIRTRRSPTRCVFFTLFLSFVTHLRR
jgi:pescadillo protein